MAITFLPSDLIQKMAPKKQVEKIVTSTLTVNKAALSSLARTGVLSKKKLTEVALKVVRTYRAIADAEHDAGASMTESRQTALNDKKLMVQRVHNASIYELNQEVQDQYRGEFARWLPSDAENPDPVHQLNYGKVYQIGEGIDGEEPGDRFGCRCGVEILVDETELEL